MLSATASPFTAFPLQIHRSLRKVKKAGPVYFGRWNIFWKSNKSAIFSFWWLREQREPRPVSVNFRKGGKDEVQHDRGDTGDTNHMPAAMPAQIAAKITFEMNYYTAQINVSVWNLWSRLWEWWWLPNCHLCCHWRACSSSQTPTRQIQCWHLSSQLTAPRSAGRAGRFTAERGRSSWLCCTRGKLILFTFNLLFPPLWNLERAKSCNTCIKNKCSRNGPTGSMQREAFVAWPRGPAAKSNRYAQYSSTYSRITITHI